MSKTPQENRWDGVYLQCVYPGSIEKARKHISGMVKLLELRQPSRILDCPCGWGRYSNLLAEQGHQVVGLDYTPAFIDIARRETTSHNATEFYVHDMRALDIENDFDAVINMSGSFGYFDRETDFGVLERFVRCLKPGGRLMIDQTNRERIARLPKTVLTHLPDGRRWTSRQSLDTDTGTYRLSYIVSDGVEEMKWDWEMQWYSVMDYLEMLNRLNLSAKVYGDFDGRRHTASSKRQIILAVK